MDSAISIIPVIGATQGFTFNGNDLTSGEAVDRFDLREEAFMELVGFNSSDKPSKGIVRWHALFKQVLL